MPTNQKDRSDLISTVALLVLDAQDCFIDTLHDKSGFLNRCAFAIDAARTLGITTLFTEQVPNKLGHTNAKLLRRARTPTLFHKESFSALSAPGIENFLRDKEIYHLLVCGLETPICVYQTGLQAVDEDIDVTFLVDALGCRRAEDALHAIQALRGLGCQVLPTETIFYSLIGDVTHPAFRPLNDLVKTFSHSDFDIEAYLNNAPLAIAAPHSQPEEQRSENDSNEERPKRRRSRNPRRGRRPEHSENSEQTSSASDYSETREPKNASEKRRPRKAKSAAPVEIKNDRPPEREKRPLKPRAATKPTAPVGVPEVKAPPAKKTAKKVLAKKRASRKVAKKAAPAKNAS